MKRRVRVGVDVGPVVWIPVGKQFHFYEISSLSLFIFAISPLIIRIDSPLHPWPLTGATFSPASLAY